jgi:hypothetical protein
MTAREVALILLLVALLIVPSSIEKWLDDRAAEPTVAMKRA